MLPHPSDIELLGLVVDEGGARGRFTLGPGLVRHDGALYGGTGLAVAVAAMEAATGRDVLWCSTQFVAQPVLGDEVRWEVERLAVGKRAAEVMVRATTEGGTAFVAIGSTGIASESGLTGQYAQMPTVSSPAASATRLSSIPNDAGPETWTLHMEMREAELVEPGATTVAFWARLRSGGRVTPAAVGFMADFVPVSVARAAGKMGAGASLDNTMRFRGGPAPAGWVLIDLTADFANGGFGHGTVRVWAADGTLLATGSQSASMRYLFDEGDAPNLPRPRRGA